MQWTNVIRDQSSMASQKPSGKSVARILEESSMSNDARSQMGIIDDIKNRRKMKNEA